jgi:hypothetical protein
LEWFPRHTNDAARPRPQKGNEQLIPKEHEYSVFWNKDLNVAPLPNMRDIIGGKP